MNKKKDLIIKAELLESIEDYSTEDVAGFMQDIVRAMLTQFKVKDKDYGGSWQKDGILSVHFNFKRKVDRILSQFESGELLSNGGGKENIADTLIDLSTYSLMYLFYLYKMDELDEEVIPKKVIDFINDMGKIEHEILIEKNK